MSATATVTPAHTMALLVNDMPLMFVKTTVQCASDHCEIGSTLFQYRMQLFTVAQLQSHNEQQPLSLTISSVIPAAIASQIPLPVHAQICVQRGTSEAMRPVTANPVTCADENLFVSWKSSAESSEAAALRLVLERVFIDDIGGGCFVGDEEEGKRQGRKKQIKKLKSGVSQIGTPSTP